jgi:hypothetical protein
VGRIGGGNVTEYEVVGMGARLKALSISPWLE